MQQLANQLFHKTIRRWVPFWRDAQPQFDALEKLSLDGNFLVIGACNHEEGLPSPLTRPGRFDKKLYFGSLSYLFLL